MYTNCTCLQKKFTKRICCQLCGKTYAHSRIRFHLENAHPQHNSTSAVNEQSSTSTRDNNNDDTDVQRNVGTVKLNQAGRAGKVCNICGKVYTSSGVLARHRQTIHSVGNVKRYHCEHCGKVFTQKSNMKVHVSAVHVGNVKMLECHVCGMKMNQKCNLKTHMRNVHDIDNF